MHQPGTVVDVSVDTCMRTRLDLVGQLSFNFARPKNSTLLQIPMHDNDRDTRVVEISAEQQIARKNMASGEKRRWRPTTEGNSKIYRVSLNELVRRIRNATSVDACMI